jgi:multimeric flavodoxin WrbA
MTDGSIYLLGICGSPRPRGNSRYLLEVALEAAAQAGGDRLRTELFTIAGKEYRPCTSCYTCGSRQGNCFQQDDFAELRDKWAAADAVIYSVPVYHLGIPGQLKCFIDRLGNSLWSYFGGVVAKSLRVFGFITQGAHIFAGQEHTLTALNNHALVMGGIPVTGDPWESYIGAAAWTACGDRKDSLRKLVQAGDRDALVAVRAAGSLGRRVAQMALLVRAGGLALRQELAADGGYGIFLQRLPGTPPLSPPLRQGGGEPASPVPPLLGQAGEEPDPEEC